VGLETARSKIGRTNAADYASKGYQAVMTVDEAVEADRQYFDEHPDEDEYVREFVFVRFPNFFPEKPQRSDWTDRSPEASPRRLTLKVAGRRRLVTNETNCRRPCFKRAIVCSKTNICRHRL
jgi:hypothetical protein